MTEFSRTFALDSIGERARAVSIGADESERAALASRFGLIAIKRLTGEATLRRGAGGIVAEGTLSAQVTQACVATGEPVEAVIDEPFALKFVAEDMLGEGDEIELSEADCDVIAHDGRVIDLGEALAQTLALALDPFPRGPGAQAALREAGVLGEDEVGPFAALKGLSEKLG